MSHPSDRWAEVDALFAEVLAQPVPERDAYLDASTTGDPALRAEVLALLASLDAAEHRIGEAAAELMTFGNSAYNLGGVGDVLRDEETEHGLPAGTRLGAYEVVREIGRGGMGTVYLAKRADADFERDVAIKIVQHERDSALWRRRFLAERRMLAALEHDNIARMYDSGTTTDGKPFLVMEYVEGDRLDQYADTHRLDVRNRLRLMLAVCEAVSFAHQRLIVHRDLKPANVLVNRDGSVKLLDFGIAALVATEATEPSATMTMQRMLTPDYASPEQARGDFVGAASDVYSLGVVLHELLAGVRPPWQRLVRERSSLAELEQALVEPSRTFSTHASSAERDTIASARASTPERLRRALAGDLDTICITALAPDPARRYQSIEALRDDLQRVLEHRPIAAKRASLPYRVRRFVQRNRALVASSAMATALAMSFVASLVVQSKRISTERDVAERQRERAEEVASLLTGLFEAADPFGSMDPDTIRAGQLLDLGAARLDSDLAARPAVQAEMQTVLGGIYQNLNRTEQARVLLERAVATRRADSRTTPEELATSLSKLGEVFRSESRFDDAEEAFSDALSLYQRVGTAASARVPGAMADLARVLNETNRFDSASVLYNRSLNMLRASAQPDTQALVLVLGDRGWLASRMGEDSLSLALSRESLVLQRAHEGDTHPTTLIIIGNVAFQLDQLGRSTEAVPLHREALAGLRRRLGTAHRSVAMALNNLASSLGRTGAIEEAVSVAEEAVQVMQRSVGREHPDVAITLNYLASAYESAGRTDDMIATLEMSYAMHVRTLGPRAPGTGIMLARLGGTRCRADAPMSGRQRALTDLRNALQVLDSVFPPPHPQRISRHITYGACLMRAGLLAEAAKELRTQAELALGNHPSSAPVVAMALRNWKAVHAQQGDSAAIARIDRIADSLGVSVPR